MKRSLTTDESGMAIITALLVLMLTSGLMAGMFAALLANQRSHSADRDQSVAYAAAHAGLEKLTASLAGLFVTDFSPSAAQLGVIDNTPPAITGFEYTAPGGAAGSGYQISFTPDPGPGVNTGNPLAFPTADITTGPFEGLKGVITPYVITATARSITGNAEVRLRRELQTVAVPVFQFGIFGEKSLGFHAGPDFDFGGRVHTNQSLYVAAGNGNTLTFRDKITAFTQVVRDTLSNGVSITLTNHAGTVMLPTVIGGAPATYRALASTENSGTIATPWAGWKSLSEDTYHANIRTQATGAKLLNLPLATAGATPIDLIRRPVVLSNEDTVNAAVFGQRYFSQASLRILLSDRSTDLTDLPTIVTATAPIDLTNLAASGYVVAAGRPPVAVSPQPDLFDPADGTSLTRLNGTPGAQPATLTIETKAAGAAWSTAVNGVPSWLRWSSIAIPAGPLTCTGLTSTLLSGCNAGAGHPIIADNTVVTVTRPGGSTVTALVNGAAALNSATITIDTFTTARNFVATRTFFVGEDPVTCTGMTATTLTGCTWPGGTALADDDPVYSGATTIAGTPLVHGFLKIEKQNAAGVWSDVTMELLNLGFAGPNQQGILCADPTPNAVIRLQRLRDNGMTTGGACNAGQAGSYTGSLAATDFWPNTIFDAREGQSRLLATSAGMNVGGVFSYAALDTFNLARWFAGAIGTTGNQALNNNGYIIYFSDRRGDHNENLVNDPETGEYGFEDSINPATAAWAKNNVLDAGEDFNENLTLESYGETPHPLVGLANAIANMRFNSASRPWDSIPLLYSGRGRLARPVLFRRALKLTNGGMVANVSNNLPASGLTVTAENPVYIQGNYNATAASVTAEPNVAAAIIVDSITLLSNAFNDAMTFQYPNDQNLRNATTTGYRFAMETGKTIPFPKPGWGVQELGSDGGVHNFMKMLEDWGGQNLRYRGSMVSLYYSRQAIGIYRADANVYGAPTRGYNFDTDFLIPALLPPGTPMFRDINTLKFRQILRPNQ